MVGRGELDIVHDQALVVNEARLAVDVGVTRWLAASIVVPVRWISSSIRYLDASGAEVELTRPGIHHRDETVGGIADPMVLGAWRRGLGAWRVTARAGVTVPIGRIEDDPFAAGAAGMAHQHIQPGTGTVNPVASAELARSIGAWRVGGFGFTQQVVYANRKGFQAGDRYAAGLQVARAVAPRWTVRGGAEIQLESAERWHGAVPTDDGNRGRFDAMLAIGAGWAMTPTLGLDLGVKVPVVTRVVGGQLSMPAIVELGVAWSYGAATPRAAGHADEDGDAHDDAHDHGDDHDGDAHDHGDDHDGDAHDHGGDHS